MFEGALGLPKPPKHFQTPLKQPQIISKTPQNFSKNFTFRHKSKAKKERFAKNMRHPKNPTPLVFRKRANHKSRNAQPQSEREPQNEARFADCAIFGDKRLLRNAKAALAFWKKLRSRFPVRTALSAALKKRLKTLQNV